MRKALTTSAALAMGLMQLAAVVVHCITIYVAYREMGLISAAVSAILPGGSELYWSIYMWWHYGFFALYVLIIIGFLLLVLFALLLAALASRAATS